MIVLDDLSIVFGSRALFEEVNIAFSGGKHYALTGPNGCGKSTLLKILMGDVKQSSGTITLPERIGILRQNIEDYRQFSVVNTVIMGNKRLWEALEERDKLYEVEIDDEVGMRLGELEAVIAEEDGYSAESEAQILLEGIGIKEAEHEKLLAELPTDLQFRVLLCQALFGQPQALLLDEPTNHLDLESIAWLEEFLADYKGVLIVVSHDKHFLNSISTDTADIDYETIIIYPGNYDQMLSAKSSIRSRAEDEAKSKEKKIARLKEFVAKFQAGSRASQVQSRIREIDRLQPQELKKSNIQRPYIRFPRFEKAPGKVIFRVENLAKAYNQGPMIIEKLSFEIQRGDKVAVIGNNGRGKTTLLKMLADVLEPSEGKIELGTNVKIGYFPQTHTEIIDKNQCKLNAFEWLKECRTGLYEQEIRAALGKMLFSGDDAFKMVSKLSGGETARLIIASMMLQDYNTLILDEANNHLDLEAVSALGQGLKSFEGTVLFSSHNRDLLTTVAEKVIAIEKEEVIFYQGNLEEYLEKKQSQVR